MQLKLGDKIRELRRKEGRTQEALADALSVTSQAVSRWESNGSYPDMEIIPSLANFFGISIDELFGYNNERSKKIDELAQKINEMNRQNNGVNINIDECLQLAREAVAEFPENETLTLCLASVLFNAGYVRYGEYHLIGGDGYSVYDIERHKNYSEWKEAIKLYEKLLLTLNEGEMRHKAVKELTQLYLNIGEYDRALSIADNAPNIHESREFLRIKACDGKQQVCAVGEALLETVNACADLIITGVLDCEMVMPTYEIIECIENAIGLYNHVCRDGDYGYYNIYISHMYMLMSVYQWEAEQYDDTFISLDKALYYARKYESFCNNENPAYTSPILKLIEVKKCSQIVSGVAASLSEDYPWWSVQTYISVKDEIYADPRWEAWVRKTQE